MADTDTAATYTSSKPSIPEDEKVDKNTAAMDALSEPSMPQKGKLADKDTPAIDVSSEPSIPLKGKNWWTDIPLREVIYYQRFAYDLDPAKLGKGFTKYARPIETEDIIPSSGTLKVTNADDFFQVELNVDSFESDELTLKCIEEFLVIAGHHDEKEEGRGFVSRSFKRLLQLPRECNPDDVTSVYKQGTLIIRAPKQEVKEAPVSDIKETVVVLAPQVEQTK